MSPRTASRWVCLSLVIVFLITGIVAVPVMHARQGQEPSETPEPAATRSVEGDIIEPVTLYSALEISFSLSRTYSNPYDPDTINVTAVFQPPTGETMEVPGFYMRPYRDTCTLNCTSEKLAPDGSAGWRVRFAPNQIGRWTYSIEAHDEDGMRLIQQGTFDVVASEHPGFIRISRNPRYFAFESGSAYFPVGENLAWSRDDGGIYTYSRWLDELSAAGVNYARLNIDTPWFISLDQPGSLGDYDNAQAAAWRFDTILQMAEQRGIYLQVILISHQLFTTASGAAANELGETSHANTTGWTSNPYNSAQGGPLHMPAAVFTDDEATVLLKQRLRYIVARWGYSPHIFAWELIDDLDGIQGYTPSRAAPWLDELTNTLRAADPYDHLITIGARRSDSAFWEIADQDFAQARFYQSQSDGEAVDQVAGTLDALGDVLAHFNGPVLLTEFSLNHQSPPNDIDPTGIHIHNTIWTAAVSGAAGAAMPWWWDSYIDHLNLYTLFDPLVLFAREVPWHTTDLKPIPPSLISNTLVTYDPLRVDDFNRNLSSDSPPDTLYQITADGAIPPTSQLSSTFYGSANPERSRPQTFIVSPPVDTELSVYIQAVSTVAPASLTITIDGLEVARVDLNPASENILVTVPISAGEHIVVLDNLGEDWLQLGYIEIAQYKSPLRALALADRAQGTLIAWIHHRDYTWQTAVEGITPATLDMNLRIPAMPIGVYRVTFWDTVTGDVIGEEQITIDSDSGGLLKIKLLPITTQLAVRAVRISGPNTQPAADESIFATRTPLPTHTATATESATHTPTAIPTTTNTATEIPTRTPTFTTTPSDTPEPSDTPTPTVTPSLTRTPRPSETPTRTPIPSPTLPAPNLD